MEQNSLLTTEQTALDQNGNFIYEVADAPEQGTEKWLAWRKLGITATEAASIMAPSDWGSPLKVYTDKLGITQNDQSDPNGFFEWGHRVEDLLVTKFMEQHPNFTRCTQGRLYQRDWMKCSLDAQCFDENGQPVIIECKTGTSLSKWDPIPTRYFAQIQWQMLVTGIRKAYFSVLIVEGGWNWFEKEVEFSPTYVGQMLSKCGDVWGCIQSKTPPKALANPEADKTAIAGIAGETGHLGSPVEVDEDTVAKYKQLKEAADKADEAFATFKNELGLKLLDVQKLVCKGKTFASWVERKGAVTIDKTILQQRFPEVYAQVTKQGLPTRYIRFNDK